MQMKAITDTYGLEEAVCLALAAGVDMIIVGNNLEYDPQILKKLVSAVLQAVKEKKIPEERIQQAWKRVQHAKEMTKGKQQ
jgi:beta-N-acetylhexosaminidase